MIDINLIGPALKQKRRAAGLTGNEATERLFPSIRTIHYQEESSIRDILMLERLCRCYDIQLADLIEEVQSRPGKIAPRAD